MVEDPILLLASSSPRRSELLARAGVRFRLTAPGPEPEADGAPARRAVLRARSKACGAAVPTGVILPVLGVDTVVEVDGEERGKASDRAAAAAMLRGLFGRVHRVHTAHCLWLPGTGTVCEELATAEVTCREPLGAELDAYLDSEQWQGKAGAYGIQDPAQTFLVLHRGAFDTVVGIHLPAVLRLLQQLAEGRR